MLELERDPHSEDFNHNKQMLVYQGHQPGLDRTLSSLSSCSNLETASELAEIFSILDDFTLITLMEERRTFSYPQAMQIMNTNTSSRRISTSKEYLAKLWGNSLSNAAQTPELRCKKESLSSTTASTTATSILSVLTTLSSTSTMLIMYMIINPLQS